MTFPARAARRHGAAAAFQPRSRSRAHRAAAAVRGLRRDRALFLHPAGRRDRPLAAQGRADVEGRRGLSRRSRRWRSRSPRLAVELPSTSSRDPRVVASAREAVQAPPRSRARTRPGRSSNGMAQHPPLYYYLPGAGLSRDQGPEPRESALRAARVLVSAGLGARSASRRSAALRGKIADPRADAVVFAASAWPLIFPMWFPEMARLGNDSLITTVRRVPVHSGVARHGVRPTFADYALLGARARARAADQGDVPAGGGGDPARAGGCRRCARKTPEEFVRRAQGDCA